MLCKSLSRQMQEVTTNGKPLSAALPFSNTEMRSEVEKAFERQVTDKNGLAAREKFAQMLEGLGLTKDEALLLLNECDPKSLARLPYKDFLDFIFGPKLNGGKTESTTSTNTTKGDAMDKAANDSHGEALSDNREPGAGIPDKTPEESAKLLAQSQDKDSRDQDRKTIGITSSAADEIKSQQDPLEHRLQSGSTELLSGKAPDGWATPNGSDKGSVATIISTPARGKSCNLCSELHSQVYEDPTDNYSYCERCWLNWYGSPPNRNGPALVIPAKLVQVQKGKVWPEDKLLMGWAEHPIPGWPPVRAPIPAVPKVNVADPLSQEMGDGWAPVLVRLNPGLVGSHARTCTQNSDRPLEGEILCNRYKVDEVVGAGHFTRAHLAIDQTTGERVCIKKHNNITVELLTDLLTIGRRLNYVDPACEYFPKMHDAFFDVDGYTVEALIAGRNCLRLMREEPRHFKKFDNLRTVAKSGLEGLRYMARAGVVHCDMKPDNIMWVDAKGDKPASVRLVDFGCSRLDSRLENGRNWALAEGGAGHVGKWAPEMVLRLRITHKADVWGLAVALLELHSGRATWSGESDTVEVILAQVLGIVNARNGLPVEMLKRSPLDIRQLYTPYPSYFPVQRSGTFGEGARFTELRPANWGLGCVLGHEDNWNDERVIFATFITTMMTLDHEKRPSAEQMLTKPFVCSDPEAEQEILQAWRRRKPKQSYDSKVSSTAASPNEAAEPSL